MSQNYNFLRKSGVFLTLMFVPIMVFAVPFSNNGVIQNVQNYSNNPFYNPSTGTFTTPHLVYNSGPALKASDCQNMVNSLIQSTCTGLNNCKNTSLKDIRPTLMIQLSKINGYNYASSCGGYIDTIFTDYKKLHSNNTNIISGNTAFPTVATTMPQSTTQQLPQWKSEYNERAAELKSLQAETNEIPSSVNKTAFPTTFNELSLTQKNEIKQQGYEPYKDAKAYVPLKIEHDVKLYKDANDAQKEEGKAVYNCIKQLGYQSETAETIFCDARREKNKNPTAQNTDNYNKASTQFGTALVSALISPCTCTNDKRFAQTFLNDIGVQCTDDFLNEQKKQGALYIDSRDWSDCE